MHKNVFLFSFNHPPPFFFVLSWDVAGCHLLQIIPHYQRTEESEIIVLYHTYIFIVNKLIPARKDRKCYMAEQQRLKYDHQKSQRMYEHAFMKGADKMCRFIYWNKGTMHINEHLQVNVRDYRLWLIPMPRTPAGQCLPHNPQNTSSNGHTKCSNISEFSSSLILVSASAPKIPYWFLLDYSSFSCQSEPKSVNLDAVKPKHRKMH